jgi:CheY-like chemotaxis protein
MTTWDCGKSVLVVEDDRDVREAIAEVLKDSEYHPVSACNGVEALQRLREAPTMPCVILLDMMMPMMDGYEFRAVQESDPSLRDIPVVVLSAHADARTAAMRMNVAGYLKKPVELETLLDTIERFCREACP